MLFIPFFFQSCALRVYDQGKIAIADYGDTDGAMHYESNTLKFSFVGKRNVSKPAQTAWDGGSKVLVSGGTSVLLNK